MPCCICAVPEEDLCWTGSGGVFVNTIMLDGESLTIEQVVAVARRGAKVAIHPKAAERVKESRAAVDEFLKQGRVIYGVTTGFGKFADTTIPREDILTLQRNLILSHSAAVGTPFEDEIVRAVMLLRANALCKGFSGIRLEVVEALVALLNARVHPVVPSQGSVGASGDLAPLSHIALVLIGEGEAKVGRTVMPGAKALEKAGIKPVQLAAKEGLALINGTQVMTAIGALAVHDAELLARTADVAGAMSLEALKGTAAAFDERICSARPHRGQAACASNLRKLLAGSAILESHRNCPKVQDAYSLRCMPQVHGASRDGIAYVRGVVEIEMNSATDNPLIFPDEDHGAGGRGSDGVRHVVISGGNFHGEPVAQAMDFLAIAVSELANISERRTERLVNPYLSGLPPFLTEHGGLNSGMMIAQYTAASLVSENKVLSSPASVDSIPTSGNQEDHVSMGTIAARKARQVVKNTAQVLAIELLCAAQGLDFLAPLLPGKGTAAAHRKVRETVPHMEQDRILYRDIAAVRQLVESGELLREVERAVGPLD